MGNAQEDIWTLVAKQLSEELSEKEAQKLDAWKKSNPENALAFDQMQQLWEQANPPADRYQPDVEKGWKRFQFQMDSERGMYDTDAEEAKNTQIRRLPLSGYQLLSVAASIILLLIAGIWWWNTASPAMVEIATAENEKQLIWLPDSSQVWLNENSKLSYAADFDEHHRVVQLMGEAFFEVREAEGRRFTIFSEGAKTEVIGTSFNLSAYPNEPVKVQVVSGKVAFSPVGEDNAVFLEAGMQAVMQDRTFLEEKAPIDDPNFRAWQNQQILFSNTRLQEVIVLLEDIYDQRIELSHPDLANCRYTATFEGASLEEILYVLSVTGDLSYELQGGTYMISGQACR